MDSGRVQQTRIRQSFEFKEKIVSLGKGQDHVKMLLIETENGYFISSGYDTMDTKIDVDIDDRIDNFVLDFF